MPDEPSPELAALDRLIAALDAIVSDTEDKDWRLEPGAPPVKAVYRPVGAAAQMGSDKNPRPAVAISFVNDELTMRATQGDLVRLMELEAVVFLGKTGRSQLTRVLRGRLQGRRRVSGGYEFTMKIESQRRVQVTAAQKLHDAIERNDPSIWNRWCADLVDGADLERIDAGNARLAGFDLSFANLADADLSGADLSGAGLGGANLEGANLDGAKMAGADLFRARIPRKYAALVLEAGLVEMESVILV